MRPVTAADLQQFWDSGADYLAADLDAEDFLLHLDAETFEGYRLPVAYDHAETIDGHDVLILCDRTALEDGAWFPDLLDDEGTPRTGVLAAAAEIITSDGLIPAACARAAAAADRWAAAAAAADAAALARAAAVADVVALAGGSQSEAARLLGIDPSRVQRMTKKAKRA